MPRSSSKVEPHVFVPKRGRRTKGQRYQRCSVCEFTEFAACHVTPTGDPARKAKLVETVALPCPECGGCGKITLPRAELIALMRKQSGRDSEG